MPNDRSTERLLQRKRIAEEAGKAHPGEWGTDIRYNLKMTAVCADNGEPLCIVTDDEDVATATHIALSDPGTTQQDIEEIILLRQENERLRSEVTRLDRESTKIMDVAICLAEMMDGKHELCPRDCDVLPFAIKCNQYTDFNGEADCDATKCWLHVALNYSADCQHNDEDMGDFHALHEAMLRKEVRKTVEEEERHG